MSGRLSKEEWRKQRDLDAARKAGTAPAEQDEEGNPINPHIPQFMAQAPWYIDTGAPSLKHQRKPEPDRKVPLGTWYVRGAADGAGAGARTRAKKWEKGACENCGARTHRTRDCIERPRKRGARWTNSEIAPDDAPAPPPELAALDADYAAKRDRWNGYDPDAYVDVIDTYAAVDAERGRRREAELDAGTAGEGVTRKAAKKEKEEKEAGDEDSDFSSASEDSEDEDKYADKASMAGTKVDKEKRMTVRNLRIREDRAKYLYNLDPNSAYYDPKTRSMREAPDPGVRPEDAPYAGDNFVRGTGDATEMERMQLFAWQAEARGVPSHLQANPTMSEMQFREFGQRRDAVVDKNRQSVLDRYGGAEHLKSAGDGVLPKELRQGQTEEYVEYTRLGQVARGREKARPSSKYQEDQLELNHTAIWGSWYDTAQGKWAYACCHSSIRGSYCTGQAGIEAAQMSTAGALLSSQAKAKAKAKAEPGLGERKRTRSSRSPSPDADDREYDRRQSRRRLSTSESHSRSQSPPSEHRRHRRRHHHSNNHHHRHKHRSHRHRDEREESGRSRSQEKDRDRPAVQGYTSRKQLGEGDVSARMDKGKLAAALQDTRGALSTAGTSTNNIDVSEEQLEAYRMTRRVHDDPMNGYTDAAV